MIKREIAYNLVNKMDTIMYVSDMETRELQFLNKYTKELLGMDEEDESYIGKKCYEVLKNRKVPCEVCKNCILKSQDSVEWEYYNDSLEIHYHVTDKKIIVNGRNYHFSVSYNNTEDIKIREELQRQLKQDQTLLKCVKTLEKTLNVDVALNKLLEIVATFYNGDRGYIFEIDYEKKTLSNTYEWVKEGVSAEIDNLVDIPLEVIDSWIKTFKEKGEFYISDLDENIDENSDQYRILKQQNIHSLIASPLISDGEIVGFYGVDNPTENYTDFTVLDSVAFFMQNDIHKRTTLAKMKELSFMDAFTGLYNRNMYNSLIDRYSAKPPIKLGVLFVDLNGLKNVNDTYGHEAGDKLIKDISEVLRSVYGKSAFRIGGDEFVVMEENISLNLLQDKMYVFKELIAEKSISVSVGTCYRDEDVNVKEQIAIADKKMYEDKARYYKNLRF